MAGYKLTHMTSSPLGRKIFQKFLCTSTQILVCLGAVEVKALCRRFTLQRVGGKQKALQDRYFHSETPLGLKLQFKRFKTIELYCFFGLNTRNDILVQEEVCKWEDECISLCKKGMKWEEKRNWYKINNKTTKKTHKVQVVTLNTVAQETQAHTTIGRVLYSSGF